MLTAMMLVRGGKASLFYKYQGSVLTSEGPITSLRLGRFTDPNTLNVPHADDHSLALAFMNVRVPCLRSGAYDVSNG